jgi:hypothetical protein
LANQPKPQAKVVEREDRKPAKAKSEENQKPKVSSAAPKVPKQAALPKEAPSDIPANVDTAHPGPVFYYTTLRSSSEDSSENCVHSSENHVHYYMALKPPVKEDTVEKVQKEKASKPQESKPKGEARKVLYPLSVLTIIESG